jgi:uroporphyrin-III C-methyltransferase
LQVAISTAGESPAVAQQLRREIDEQLPENLGPWLAEVGQLRREILATHPAGEERKALLHRIAKRRILQRPQAHGDSKPETAKVFLVGAGPGDPDLLTVKAQRLIGAADVILHDDLVTPEILALANPDAEIVNVGKRCGMKNITQQEINSLLVSYAADHRIVVRLKSGDPMIFGRAAEEMAALGEAGVPFEVVPGITAAFAAAAAIPCSLTDRQAASNVVFSTGHHAQSHNEAAIPELEDATRIVYMPGRDLTLLALQWQQEGLPTDLPCAIVSHAGRPEQHVTHTTLAELGRTEPVGAPSILLAGWALKKPVNAAIETQQGAIHS